jgi:hypothetical protein
VEDKAIGDLKKNREHPSSAKRFYFCSSQRLTEKRCDEITATLQPFLSQDANIVVLGAPQLADLTGTHPAPLRDHYSAEIADCIETLKTDRPAAEAEDVQFHLALTTVGHSDSEAIRRSLYAAAVRVALSDGRHGTVGDCCRDMSQHFHLSRQLPPEAVQYHLDGLIEAGEVERQGARYRLTDAGEEAYRQQEANVASNLLDGRLLVREHLEVELGRSIGDDQFNRLWKVFQEKIAFLFYQRGMELVRAVGSLLERENQDEPLHDMKDLVNSLADAVSMIAAEDDVREELHTAIVDLFTTPTGKLLEWLVRLCSSFVSLCSLGLEAQSGAALAQLISRIALIFDTDVVLSLVCEGESQHESARAVVSRWRTLGGQLYVAAPVLHEVAHHAWIAETDFAHVKKWIPGSEADRTRLIENAFVRGFAELLSVGKAQRGHWPRYIAQYCGDKEDDTVRIAETLSAECGIQVLPPRGAAEYQIEREVGAYLKEQAEARDSGRRLRIALDKAARDAQLFATMVSYRRQAREADPSDSCLLVSSARRLSNLEKRFTRQEEPHVVISVAAVTHLLSLVPDVSLSLGAMRALLFDTKRRRSEGLERLVLRVLRETQEVDLPWARRTTLMRDLRKRLVGEARLLGERVENAHDRSRVEARAIDSKHAPETAAILKSSLENLAVQTRVERENEILRRRVLDQDDEIERLKRVRTKKDK